MRLLWAGIVEAAAAAAVGAWLYGALPSADHVWAEAIWFVAAVALAASLAWGREPATPADEAGTGGGAAPAPRELPALAEPPPAVAMGAGEPEPVAADEWLRPVGGIQAALWRSRWTLAALDAERRAQALAETVLGRTEAVEAAGAALEELADLTILAQGFRALAQGHVPHFDLTRFAPALSSKQVTARLKRLQAETEALGKELEPWTHGGDDRTGPDRVVQERIRYERLEEGLRQRERLWLLERGWSSLYQTLGGEGTEP
ncbi:MAG: hypothetical protein K6V97_12855 [Actinomycetia bacterium]|nr:hypothetical protein [Actinomycetes bacterium]